MGTRIMLGRTDDGDRVTVEINLDTHPVRGSAETIHHEPFTGPFTRLSITGEVVGYKCREPHSCGQIRDALAEITRPAPGWTLASIAAFGNVWRHWHLNDMRAACAHMETLPDDVSYHARKGITCPVTGYRYGQAWLYEPIPAGVLDYVNGLVAAAKAA